MTENDKIKTVVLVNKAQFKFSRYFDEDNLNEKLQTLKTIYSLNPLINLPKYADTLEEEVIRKSIHSTAAIEGNTLTEDEVGKVMKKSDQDDLLKDSEQQIKNLQNVYGILKVHGEDILNPMLDKDQVNSIHKKITVNLRNEGNIPGKYRIDGREVGNKEHGGLYKPPKIAKDIRTLMNSFFRWINSDKLKNIDPIYRAALAHYHLGKIHPFGDGNGRTARFVEAILLRSAGYKYAPEMLSNYYYRHLDEYFIIFSKTIRDKKQDISPFINFMVNGLIWSILEIHARLVYHTMKSALNSYFTRLREKKELTQRQYDLLLALLSIDFRMFRFSKIIIANNAPFGPLYRNVQARAIDRDIAKLEKMNLIVKAESGLYKLYLGD